MKVTILGSGASSGVPSIEAGWGDCDPKNPKNRRTRPSILIEKAGKRLLIDTAPDFREQMLRAGVRHLDGLVLTHGHADHLHGIDDIRSINRAMGAAIPLWTDAETLASVQERFAYVLAPLHAGTEHYYKPTLTANVYAAGTPFTAAGIDGLAFEQDHGFSTTHGLRFGPLAYTTDLVRMTDAGVEAVRGVHTWIVGVFAWQPHPTHLHVDAALELRERIQPQRMVITHMSPRIDYDALTAYVPDGVEVAYDGMELDVPDA
ncbi:MAG: MBL fold metallo-hydrolase [Alphaproteobacteria bacterium]